MSKSLLPPLSVEQKQLVLQRLVILTGAGISAESGLKTFRDAGGLWENHRVDDVATPEAYEADPELVWRFYHQRRLQLSQVQPNSGHQALVQLEQGIKRLGGEFLLITQNVDDLHERAGSLEPLHMHGELLKIRCNHCGLIEHTHQDLFPTGRYAEQPKCQHCDGRCRPHIVWFGEMPFEMDRIQQALKQATCFVAIGTSGVVYPAAGFLALAKQWGALTIGFNQEPPDNVSLFDLFYQGQAGILLPQWLEQIESSTLHNLSGPQ